VRTDNLVLQKGEPTKRSDLRILIVDDDETDRLAVRRHLSGTYSSAILEEAGSGADAMHLVGTTSYDCVLLDHVLPDATALSLVPRIQTAAPDLPIVMFTGRGDEDIAVELSPLRAAPAPLAQGTSGKFRPEREGGTAKRA
jgi:CheY-like chemotaxis protein